MFVVEKRMEKYRSYAFSPEIMVRIMDHDGIIRCL